MTRDKTREESISLGTSDPPDASSAHTRSGCFSSAHPAPSFPERHLTSSRPGPSQDAHLQLRSAGHSLRSSVAFLEAAWSWEAGTQQRWLLLREAQQRQPGPHGCRSSLQDCAPGQTSVVFPFPQPPPLPRSSFWHSPRKRAPRKWRLVTTLLSPPRSALSTDSLTSSLGKSSTLTTRLLSRTALPPTFLGRVQEELWDCVSLTSSVLSSAPRSCSGEGGAGS